jgi:hypothetical protein
MLILALSGRMRGLDFVWLRTSLGLPASFLFRVIPPTDRIDA